MKRPEKYSFAKEQRTNDNLMRLRHVSDPYDWAGSVSCVYGDFLEKRELNIRYRARMSNKAVFMRYICPISA